MQGPDSTPSQPWVQLEDWVRQRWTGAGKVVHRWSGQVGLAPWRLCSCLLVEYMLQAHAGVCVQLYQPIDGLHLNGRDPPHFFDLPRTGNIYTATGDSGQGTTGATTAGAVIAAAICNRPDPYRQASSAGPDSLLLWLACYLARSLVVVACCSAQVVPQIFSPTRFPSPLEDTASNLGGVLKYVGKGYLGAVLPNSTTVADMPRSSGAVVTEGLRKVRPHAGIRLVKGCWCSQQALTVCLWPGGCLQGRDRRCAEALGHLPPHAVRCGVEPRR